MVTKRGAFMERGYYMVRAMLSRKEDLDVFFNQSVVAIGWSKVDLTQSSDTEILRKIIHKAYYDNNSIAPQTAGRNLNEVTRFKNIKQGDYIVVPYWNTITLARAEKEEIYSPEDGRNDLANQRKVKYEYENDSIKRIPRDSLSEGLQRRLRVRGMTVSDLSEFAGEIEELYQGHTYNSEFSLSKIETAYIEKFKATVIANIQSGKTNLQAGGIGLEDLVVELCQCEGYDAKKLSKKNFNGLGDADVEIVRADRFTETKALIQVKHHQNETSLQGIKQLEEITKDPRYKDYSLIFLASCDISREAKEKADELGIQLINGDSLAEWIFDHHEKLSPKTKETLRISAIPQLME